MTGMTGTKIYELSGVRLQRIILSDIPQHPISQSPPTGGVYVVIIMNYTNSLFTEKRSYVTLSSSQATCQLVNLKRDFS